jgi:hypothetical protein
MKFKSIREQALKKWLEGTNRKRVNDDDDYNESFECRWQTRFGKQVNEDEHYSVFCSIGDWSTNITDMLIDERFDDMDLLHDNNIEVLFRHYTKILLLVSEILTDFQDLLSTLRNERFLKNNELNTEKTQSRQILDKKSCNGDTQMLFTFINNVCKHKVNNIHVCNHHLKYCFADGAASTSENTITIKSINLFIPGSGKAPKKMADTIEMPKLLDIIEKVVNSYIIVEEEFLSETTKFDSLCNLYKGIVK